MLLFAKILAGTLLLALLFAAGFSLWGTQFEILFNQQACVTWFSRIRPYAWLIGIALMTSDLLLPIPATGIMAALGSVYGLWLGTFFSILGSTITGFTGYGLARFTSRKITRHLASQDELDRFHLLFNRWGGAAIIISRIMPIMPEVMVILAGISRMNILRFTLALLLGTVPTSFLFVYLGQATQREPVWGIGMAVVLPLLVWPFFLRFFVPAHEPTANTANTPE